MLRQCYTRSETNAPSGAKRGMRAPIVVGWRYIALALIDSYFGEEKAQSCAIAWLQHLPVFSVLMPFAHVWHSSQLPKPGTADKFAASHSLLTIFWR